MGPRRKVYATGHAIEREQRRCVAEVFAPRDRLDTPRAKTPLRHDEQADAVFEAPWEG